MSIRNYFNCLLNIIDGKYLKDAVLLINYNDGIAYITCKTEKYQDMLNNQVDAMRNNSLYYWSDKIKYS